VRPRGVIDSRALPLSFKRYEPLEVFTIPDDTRIEDSRKGARGGEMLISCEDYALPRAHLLFALFDVRAFLKNTVEVRQHRGIWLFL
jgi:hypothetical protein